MTDTPEGWTIQPDPHPDCDYEFFHDDYTGDVDDTHLWGFGPTRKDCIEQINVIIKDRGM